MPIGATPRDSLTGNVINNRELTTRRKDPRERWQVERDIESVNGQIERVKSDKLSWTDQFGVEHTGDKLRPEAEARLLKLKQQRRKLHDELDLACG